MPVPSRSEQPHAAHGAGDGAPAKRSRPESTQSVSPPRVASPKARTGHSSRRVDVIEKRRRAEDLKTNRDGTISALIRRAKNDQFGAGRLGLLSKKTVSRLRCWLRLANLKSGPVFRAIDRHGHVRHEALDGSSINRIIKAMASDARLPKATAQALSGHSMRVGRAQDLMLDGFDLLPIMKAGGWKSFSVVGRYVENVELAKLLKGRGAWE